MNYYEELGVNQRATLDEIKRAYRKLAKKHHPDKNPNNEQATKRFVRIASAYETLSDEQKRKKYDATQNVQNNKSTKKRSETSETATVNPMNMGDFEDFFGFTTNNSGKVVPTDKNKKKATTNPIDTSQMFERFFGKNGG